MDSLSGVIPSHLMHTNEGPSQKKELGKQDFLKLLMTQLQNQDPLNPKDHDAFIAQLAQFSSLEQLSNIGTGIEGLKTQGGNEAKLQALGMIGKTIQAGGNRVSLVPGSPVSVNVETEDGLTPVKAQVYGERGQLVREIPLSRNSGNEVLWDGLDTTGTQVPGGTYLVRVFGVGVDGGSRELRTQVEGVVTGVDVKDSKPVLMLKTKSGQTRVELGTITRVSEREPAAPSKDAPVVAKQEATTQTQSSTQPYQNFSVGNTWGRIQR